MSPFATSEERRGLFLWKTRRGGTNIGEMRIVSSSYGYLTVLI
jgi:hypothetical protein